MHQFSMGSRACSPGKFLNLESLKCHFPDFGERLYRILTVRKRHCNISEASLANVFALHSEPGGLDFIHWGWGRRVRPVRTHSSYATGFEWKLFEKENKLGCGTLGPYTYSPYRKTKRIMSSPLIRNPVS